MCRLISNLGYCICDVEVMALYSFFISLNHNSSLWIVKMNTMKAAQKHINKKIGPHYWDLCYTLDQYPKPVAMVL